MDLSNIAAVLASEDLETLASAKEALELAKKEITKLEKTAEQQIWKLTGKQKISTTETFKIIQVHSVSRTVDPTVWDQVCASGMVDPMYYPVEEKRELKVKTALLESLKEHHPGIFDFVNQAIVEKAKKPYLNITRLDEDAA